jgi:hypothetical protein
VEGSGGGLISGRQYPIIFLEGLRKSTDDVNHNNRCPAEIRMWRLSGTSLKRYRLSQLAYLGEKGDRAIAQAVSSRLPTAAVLVRAQVRSCGICGGQSGSGVGFI